jgi:nucleotide-binding universal stress UspA family protein
VAKVVRQAKVDGVTVHTKLVESVPAKALIDESADADLVVVGSRGRGGFASMLLGSVSRAVVQHSACPVAVIRHSSH